jgi:phage terminase large subunit
MPEVFPVYYRPRPYQAELHKMWRTKRYGIAVLPRQSGKDVAASMEQCDARLKTGKTTGVYISLNNPTIRDILWDKTYLDPESKQFIKGLQDNVPETQVDWKNTVMEGRFKNGSRLKLQGYFQSGSDTSGVGTSFQDYTITELALFHREDPIPRLMPILDNESEQKRLMAVSTPRGKRKNPLWQLMESLKGNPQAQVIVRTIDDLNEMMHRHGLPPVRTPEQLELTREAYLKRFGNDRMFEQEYYCSFEEMDAAAVYGEAYMKLVNEKRVFDFNINPGHPVYVVFDIGSSGMHSDATAWIAFQWINGRIWIYDCGEGHGKAVPEYVDVLREKPYFNRIAQMILPWDAEHHEKAVNTTPADMMRTKFPNIAVLAKSNKVYKLPGGKQGDFDIITDIQQARLAMYNTVINGSNCQWLLECFELYKYEFNTKLQEWTNKPLHDKHSHMMDAFRYLVQATKELDFFGGQFFDTPGVASMSNLSYTEDWSDVWAR